MANLLSTNEIHRLTLTARYLALYFQDGVVIYARTVGATGAFGSLVLYYCLEIWVNGKIAMLGRCSCGRQHLKFREVIDNDFSHLISIAKQFEQFDEP